MSAKYELTATEIEVGEVTLYQIKALKDFEMWLSMTSAVMSNRLTT